VTNLAVSALSAAADACEVAPAPTFNEDPLAVAAAVWDFTDNALEGLWRCLERNYTHARVERSSSSGTPRLTLSTPSNDTAEYINAASFTSRCHLGVAGVGLRVEFNNTGGAMLNAVGTHGGAVVEGEMLLSKSVNEACNNNILTTS
jgi:hypothetical protein